MPDVSAGRCCGRCHRGSSEVLAAVAQGGYPEIVTEQLTSRVRSRWFEAYASETVDREAVRSLVEPTPGPELRRFLRVLAAMRYLALLEALYLMHLQPAWATSATTRAKRASKIHLVDTGLATSLLGLGERELGALERDRELGFLLESFVVTELCKQATWTDRAVDIIVEQRNRCGDSFTVGVVLHLGSTVVPLGGRLWAVPVPALWTPW